MSSTAKALILGPVNGKLVSPASPWDAAIKVSLGKLDICRSYLGFFPK